MSTQNCAGDSSKTASSNLFIIRLSRISYEMSYFAIQHGLCFVVEYEAEPEPPLAPFDSTAPA